MKPCKCIYMSCMKFSCSLIAFQYRLRLCICHWLYLHVKCWKNFSDLIHKREVITAFVVKECQDFGLHTCTGFIPLRIIYAFSVVLCLLYCILNMRYKFRANLYYFFFCIFKLSFLILTKKMYFTKIDCLWGEACFAFFFFLNTLAIK